MSYTTNPQAPRLRMQAVKLVRKGWSMRRVSRHFGYAPSTISRWFISQINSLNISHRNSRIRKPNDNAHIERFNRTLQDECINLLDWATLPQEIPRALPSYIHFYNHSRPHLSLNFLTPSKVLQSY